MMVTIKRSGGYAGGPPQTMGPADTKRLKTDAADRLRRSVAALSAAVAQATVPVQADMFRYDVDIHDDDGSHRSLVVFDQGDSSDPPFVALQGLIQALG